MRLRRLPQLCTGFQIALVCLLAACAAFGNVSCPVRELATLSGKYSVGTTIFPVQQLQTTGTSRQVQLWYPASPRSKAAQAEYVPDASLLAALRTEKFLNLPECVFDAWEKMVLPARVDAEPVTQGVFPLVLIAPGAGVSRISYTFYAEQLVSDGYMVATIDFGEGGFLMREGKHLQEGPEPKDESDYGKQALQMVAHMSDLITQLLDQQRQAKPSSQGALAKHIDPTRIAAVGHSLGGAAALDMCLMDPRVKACVDLDGIPESPVAEKGIVTSALMLRSQPDYSDADLKKLHRDPVEWNARGQKIKEQTAKLLSVAGPDAWVISIDGTGHMSYSDAPFTMPGTLAQFGGTYLEPQRILSMTTSIVENYLQHAFAQASFSVSAYPEATIQASRSR
jgi:dienelactone hydrolase